MQYPMKDSMVVTSRTDCKSLFPTIFKLQQMVMSQGLFLDPYWTKDSKSSKQQKALICKVLILL